MTFLFDSPPPACYDIATTLLPKRPAAFPTCMRFRIRISGDKLDRTPGAVDQGYNFQEQWKRAFQLKPPFVMVTGWNEWIAGRHKLANGTSCFCDQFNQEFSRDIEPMKGGHGDNYDWQLVANVRRFKGAPPLPRASSPASIRIDADFRQWQTVGPEFLDNVGD